MLEVTLRVNAPDHMAQTVKESLCMTLEPYGDVRAVSVRALGDEPERYVQERIPMTGGR